MADDASENASVESGGTVEVQDTMDVTLTWIGFNLDVNRQAIRTDIAELEDMLDITEKDISDLSESYAKRTVNDGRIIFGLQRTKRLKAMLHWVQDFYRVSAEPSIDGINAISFKEALAVAAKRAVIRKQEAKDSSSVSSEASPGKLKNGEKQWTEWITGFENMLSTLLGVNGVPLSYVVRELEEPAPEGHDTFVQKCIACAPLQGPHFEADARRVHQLVTSFTQGENSEQWIKMHVKKQNGRVDLKALYAHYQGAGNTTRRIAEAVRLRETLHYKNERSLSFATFLSKVQHMFNLFEEEGEPMTEPAKFRFLLDKVHHPQLTSDISALRVQSNLATDRTTFTDAANILAASVSTMPESILKTRGISAVGQLESTGDESIYRNGKIFTGYYKNFHGLSKTDQGKVIAEREKLNLTIKKGGGQKKKNGRQASATESGDKEITAIKRKLKQANRKIASLQSRDSDEESDYSEDELTNTAGNAFGGRNEKKNGKSRKKK